MKYRAKFTPPPIFRLSSLSFLCIFPPLKCFRHQLRGSSLGYKETKKNQQEILFSAPDSPCLSSSFESRGRECVEWARKMKEKEKTVAISWYIRAFFAFMKGKDLERGERVMKHAIKLLEESEKQDGTSIVLAQCLFQFALAKLELGRSPKEEIERGRRVLDHWIKHSPTFNPFLPPSKRYKGVASAFMILSLFWKGERERARKEWEEKRQHILASWNWYREGIKTLITSLIQPQRISVREALQKLTSS